MKRISILLFSTILLAIPLISASGGAYGAGMITMLTFPLAALIAGTLGVINLILIKLGKYKNLFFKSLNIIILLPITLAVLIISSTELVLSIWTIVKYIETPPVVGIQLFITIGLVLVLIWTTIQAIYLWNIIRNKKEQYIASHLTKHNLFSLICLILLASLFGLSII